MSLTQEKLEHYARLDERRRTMQREIDALEREQKPLKEEIKAYVVAKGGSDRTCTHYGFVLSLQARAGRVDWKGEFVQLQGFEAAAKLQNAAPQTFIVNVEAPA
jgi:seryl-tRNA synthetase